MPRLPWTPFYTSDHFLDTRCLTLAERGLWMDLLCLLWREEPRGSAVYPPEIWAGKCGVSVEQFLTHLQGIKSHRVGDVSIVEQNVSIVSRRMKREQTRREQNKSAQQRYRQRLVSIPKLIEDRRQSTEGESEGEKKKIKSPRHKVILPDDFKPNPDHEALAKLLGLHCYREFAKFSDSAKTHARVYADWPAAFRNWLRNAQAYASKGGAR